jgi:hypothetical protein
VLRRVIAAMAVTLTVIFGGRVTREAYVRPGYLRPRVRVTVPTPAREPGCFWAMQAVDSAWFTALVVRRR